MMLSDMFQHKIGTLVPFFAVSPDFTRSPTLALSPRVDRGGSVNVGRKLDVNCFFKLPLCVANVFFAALI